MKKLIFCFDGTCNEPEDAQDYFADGSISNILKMHIYLGGTLQPLNSTNEQTPSQHSFYYSGVGTRGNWLKRKFNALFAPPYGDMDDIIDEANADLTKHFSTGDEIYILGFSRGAAIARMFAAHLKQTVKFLGVFDTVAATRGSLDLNPNTFPASGIVFEDDVLGHHIEKAVHLLALDEKRLAFQPTLFNKDSRVTEVWFAGAHSDIGGSYWFDGLSDICLQFMIEQVHGKVKVLYPQEIDYQRLVVDGAQDTICFDDLNIKPLVAGKIHSQIRTNTNALTLAPRLVRVNEGERKSEYCPVIHHSVVERFHQVVEYRPYALRNVCYKVLGVDGKLRAKRCGISELA